MPALSVLRVLPFLAAAGEIQFAVDEACLQRVREDPELSLVRFYRFDPPCVSLGRFQRRETIDEPAIRTAGLEILRRQTGGRAVLHQDELTYMVAAGARSPLFPGGIRGSMARIAEAFRPAFARFSLQVEVEGSRKALRSTRGACFDAPSLLELKFQGRKLMGSAQRRLRDAFVQHGSIPIHYDEARNRAWLGAPATPHAACAAFLSDAQAAESFIAAVIENLAGENGLEIQTVSWEFLPLEVLISLK